MSVNGVRLGEWWIKREAAPSAQVDANDAGSNMGDSVRNILSKGG